VEVLVVDDSREVREAPAVQLSDAGYRVHQAAGGDEAVAVFHAHPGQIRFALIDVWMPGRDGPATAAALRQVAPGLPFAFMTGDPARIMIQELLAAGAATVLLKPFDLEQLIQAIAALTQVPRGPLWREGDLRKTGEAGSGSAAGA
jgi:CheY-like chemotaxis protein